MSNFGLDCADTTTCNTKAMSADAASEACARAQSCPSGARVITSQAGYILADGQACCNLPEVGIAASKQEKCIPAPPRYSCVPDVGCSYCPHPLFCPKAVSKEECEDSCNPQYKCVDGQCQKCADP